MSKSKSKSSPPLEGQGEAFHNSGALGIERHVRAHRHKEEASSEIFIFTISLI